MPPFADHELRYDLANELHARPFPRIAQPATVAYLAIKQPEAAAARDRQADLDHLVALLDRFGAPHPRPEATHYHGPLGKHWLRWESHTEFVSYTLICEGLSARAFDPADFDLFPRDWLDDMPGVRVTSALIRVAPWQDRDATRAGIDEWFVGESVAVARVLDDSAVVAGDFRIDAAGHQRFSVTVAPDCGPRRVGRIVTRLCEIETYTAMSMLGFARARALGPRMAVLDARLSGMIDGMAGQDQSAEDMLAELLDVSAELEALVAQASFRFGATAAYARIVNQRIEVLRETRFEGRQTFAEFMMRRYEPAMRTVRSTQARLDAMAARARRAGELLRTRVDVERSAQNQAVLERMDRRAELQLRLQKTVEGLSVVAISYYAVSLVGYVLYPLAGVLGVSKGWIIAAVTLPVVAAVWWAIGRLKKRME